MYPGGKNGNGTYQNIICQFPPHQMFGEIFLGSGAVANNKKRAELNWGVEIDPAVIDSFTYDAGLSLYNECAFKFIKRNYHWFYNPNLLVYLDPPYPKCSRKDQRNLYDYEFTDKQHIKLLELIKPMTCMVAISTYENDIYKEHLKDWRLYKFESATHTGLATEYLYMNYPEPKRLHEYTFLGKDFTDRQRIKRKIQREIDKLKRLPTLERAAILEAINGS